MAYWKRIKPNFRKFAALLLPWLHLKLTQSLKENNKDCQFLLHIYIQFKDRIVRKFYIQCSNIHAEITQYIKF